MNELYPFRSNSRVDIAEKTRLKMDLASARIFADSLGGMPLFLFLHPYPILFQYFTVILMINERLVTSMC